MARYSPEALEKKRAANEARFLHNARAKFGDRFDYSQIRYQQQKTPVTIVCPDHGAFVQTPDRHLQSELGCPKCGVLGRAARKNDIGREGFLKAFQIKHGERIELLSKYSKAREPIRCRCKVHGVEFDTTPDRLIQWKHCCPVCAREGASAAQTLSQQEFLKRARDKFGEQFDLSRTVYAGMDSKVVISCPIHGEFKVTPVSFLYNTHGCPKCGRLYVGHAENRIKMLESGQTKSRPTTLAVMKVEVFGITGYKVGTTARTLLVRYREALREVLFETTLDELNALKLEQLIHAKYFRSRDVRIFLAGLRNRERWPGDSEIYEAAAIPSIIKELSEAVAAIAEGCTDYWQHHSSLKPPKLEIRSVRKVPGLFNMAKPVIRLDTLERYPSADAAANAIGGSAGNLSMVCRGERASVKGVRFAYVSDYEAGTIPQHQPRTGANNPKARKVICLNTGAVFDTVTDAATATGVDSSKVVSVCKGKRGSASGFHFAYLSDHESGTIPQFNQKLRGKENYRARAVRCIETGVTYGTVTEAANATGAKVSAIVRVCKNAGKTAGGFRWEYI